jgi:hypothetical protein
LKSFFLIGGGRWSRVVLCEASKLQDQNLNIIVVSKKNHEYMKKWVSKTISSSNVKVVKKMPDFVIENSSAYVLNETTDRYRTLQKLLDLRIPTLVEKPLMLDYQRATKIVDLYQSAGIALASSQVFRFLKGTDALRAAISKDRITSIKFDWFDSNSEIRYGEIKKFEKSVPIYYDILPHIYSMICGVFGDLPINLGHIKSVNDSKEIALSLKLNYSIDLDVNLSRIAETRKRLIQIQTAVNMIEFDFSTNEVIKYSINGIIISAQNFGQSSGIQEMLKVFLQSNREITLDPRIDIKPSLNAVKLCQNIQYELEKL